MAIARYSVFVEREERGGQGRGGGKKKKKMEIEPHFLEDLNMNSGY